jgi:O-antigen/teichoic acid export membrane protein
VYFFVARRLLPDVKLRLGACRLTMAKEILNFSIQTYVTQVAVVIHNQIEKLYLAQLTGVAAVGWYEVSSDTALKLRGIPSLVLAPIMPAASELYALSDQSRLTNLYYRTHKYLALIGVPLVAYIAFVAKRFVDLWVGPAFDIVAIPLSVLLIANFINLTTGPGFLILVGGGRLRPGLYSAILGIVLNLSVSLFLIRAYGFHGAVLGTSISLVVASAFFLFMFHRETSGAFTGVVRRAYLMPILSSSTALAIPWMLIHSAESSWSRLVLAGIGFGCVYLVMLVAFKFFDQVDLAIAETVLPIPEIVRRAIPNAELGSPLLPDSERTPTAVG